MATEEDKKEEEVEIKPTDTLVERLAAGIAITTTPNGLILVDFLKPVLSLMATKSGKITAHKGELRPDVRIYLPPKVAKSFRDALNTHIEKYEKEYGEIK